MRGHLQVAARVTRDSRAGGQMLLVMDAALEANAAGPDTVLALRAARQCAERLADGSVQEASHAAAYKRLGVLCLEAVRHHGTHLHALR